MGRQDVTGSWSVASNTAGGCPKNPDTWTFNPTYALAPSRGGTFKLTIAQNGTRADWHPAGLLLLHGERGQPVRTPLVANAIVKKSKYKKDEQELEVALEGGKTYVVLPSTYEPGLDGSFTLVVASADDDAFTFGPHVTAGASLARAPSTPAAPVATLMPQGPPGGGPPPLKEEQVWQEALRGLAQNSKDGKFVDPEFEARPQDQQKKGKALYMSGQAPRDAKKVDNWTRLETMTQTTAGGAGSLFVKREGLSDGWLLSALGMVGTRPELLQRVVESPKPGSGMHAVRLHKEGRWVTTVVDDLMPCHGKGTLAYSSNASPRDGAVALVQKALAKLYGCYEHLNTGRVGSALEDLTGGIHDKIYLRDGLLGADQTEKQQFVSAAEEVASGAMWRRLKGLRDGGHLLGASYRSKYAAAGDQPVMSSDRVDHLVYPIVEMREVDNLQLVRLANPWSKLEGDKGPAAPEWSGPWAAASGEWAASPNVAAQLGGKPPADGSFWMPFDSLVRTFNKVHICRLPVVTHTERRVAGEWAKATAGGMLSSWPGSQWRTNPQYRITVGQKTTALLSLSQVSDSAQLRRNSAQLF